MQVFKSAHRGFSIKISSMPSHAILFQISGEIVDPVFRSNETTQDYVVKTTKIGFEMLY